MQTGIHLDYVRDDVTAAALRLAGFLHTKAQRADFFTERTQRPVHGLWDKSVLSRGREEVFPWVRRSSECVWFRHDVKKFRQAVRAQCTREHILVPRWHELRRKDFDWIGVHNMVVCPSPSMAVSVEAAMKNRNVSCPVKFIYWSSGTQQIEKMGYLHGEPKLMIVIDRSTLHRYCDEFLHTLAMILTRVKPLYVTLAIESGWPKKAKDTVKRLLHEFGSRLAVRRSLPMDQRLLEINGHDWLWLASVRGTTGFPIQEALACGVPTIVWNVEPFSELVLDRWNGRCLPCKRARSEVDAPTAKWNSNSAIKVISDAFRSEEELLSLQEKDWLLSTQNEDFCRFWEQIVKN
jgi:glycosyltransferase involved in cell wall biosynthesis